MQKVIVIGCPGSGKSTFSKALHRITHIPLYHLDMLYWNEDRTTVEKAVFHQRLGNILLREQWIIDGNYASTMEWRLQECDTIIFLDYPVETCLAGIRQRQGKARSDIPWTETEEDEEFLSFIKNFEKQGRPQILELLGKHPHKQVHIFANRLQANAYLTRLQAEYSRSPECS